MLEVVGIQRSFGNRLVLNDVGFTCASGTLTGFVGGNGAGKTTTMRIIMGVLSADSGRVLLDGTELGAEQRQGFGYMPEERGLYPKMQVHDQLVYLARLHGYSKSEANDRSRDLIDRLGLSERANDLLDSLSLGNQQRAQIAAALVHDPEVLILDEPFSGLDPMAVDVVLGVLTEFAAKGAPVLFSSHQLDVVERLCDNLVIIANGAIRASGTREELRAQFSSPRYEILSDGDMGWLRSVVGVEVVDFDGGYALFDAADDSIVQNVLQTTMSQSAVLKFGPSQPSLGEIFREVIADASTGEQSSDAVVKTLQEDAR